MIVIEQLSNIYVFTNKLNNKKYVGQSINPKERYRQHFKDARNDNLLFHNALNKYGKNNFDFEIIETDIPLNIISSKEKYWIKELNTMKPNGYNLTVGGEGTFGYCHTEESKMKMSLAKKGRFTHFQTVEAREKISKSHENRIVSDETKRKISNSKKGTIISEETKKKLSNATKGIPHSEVHNQHVKTALNNMLEDKKKALYEKAIKTKKENGVDFAKHFKEMNDEDKNKMYDTISKNNPRSKNVKGINLETNEIFTFNSLGNAGKWIHETFGYSKNSKVGIRRSIDSNGTAYGFRWEYI